MGDRHVAGGAHHRPGPAGVGLATAVLTAQRLHLLPGAGVAPRLGLFAITIVTRPMLFGARAVSAGLRLAGRRAAPRLVEMLVPLAEAAAPRIIDSLLPRLERDVIPTLIDAALPVLRERVIPVVIEDLTDSPLVRALVLEQSRGVASQAADRLRTATADADDRVEGLFSNLVHRDREP